LNELVARVDVDPMRIDDVIMGCVSQIGEQSSNMARNAILSSVLPESVPGTTIDRQCGSSQQALHFAAQAVMSGTQDIVIAAGVESMTRVPMFLPSSLAQEHGYGFHVGPAMEARYPDMRFSQFVGAERMARKYGFSREDLDRFALLSHQRAARAVEAGVFKNEILPLQVRGAQAGSADELHLIDEGIRFDATFEGIGSVKLL